ncbi:MAG: efflux transporter periplasmic adaptor subunit [Myxococcaceae bacterium]|nr:efflux transporter periplasmic adaptor subunit [Myxococcaceae bacterium]
MAETNSSALNDTDLKIPDNAGRNRLPKLLAAGAVLALLVAGAVYYFRPKPVPELYLTSPVQRRDIVQRIEAAGRLDVRTRVEIPAPVEGRLVSINAHSGDTVAAGQLLAVMDARSAQLAVRTAQASELAAASGVREAQTAADAAQQTLSHVQKLNARGLASTNDLQNAEAELARAKAAVDQLRANQRVAGEGVASARLSQSLGQITATNAGVVLRAPERVGAAVSPAAGPLFVIGDPLELMRVDAKVSETDIAVLRVGQAAQVSVSALEDKTFTAKVETRGIEPEQELGAVLYPVTLLVENPDRLLLPGMSASVKMEVREQKNALSVHEAALRFVPEDAPVAPLRSRVFRRVGADQLEAVPVKAGISDGMYTAVEPLNGQTLSENEPLAIGFIRPDQGSKGPRVTLGDKK